MDTTFIIAIGIVVVALAIAGVMLFFFLAPKPSGNIKGLMGNSGTVDASSPFYAGGTFKPNDEELIDLNKKLTYKIRKSNVVTQEDLFFRAGLFVIEDRKVFHNIKLIAPIVASLLLGLAGLLIVDSTTGLAGFVLGLLIGAQLPKSYLDRKIKRRNEDIMFYLPLVIEQIVIGVSSSLDTGPCIQRVVAMADERNSHNPVTELLRHAQHYTKSGVSFEEAMNEVGALSGHPELKHAFKSLAQVAKYGGEISKQLQELADAVSQQRETMIETKIKRLELEATGPVGLVFFGFMIIFLSGLGAQVMKAFN